MFSLPPIIISQRLRLNGDCKGFTVTELLIVVAVIAVLFAILLPASQNAVQSALQARCANNLKQVAVGLRAYATDRGGRLPGFGSSAYDTSSLGPLNQAHRKVVNGGYLPNADAFFCPADNIRRPLRNETGWAQNPEQGNANYNYSGYFHMYHRVGSLPTSSLPDDKERCRLTDNPKAIITSCQWEYGPFKAFHKGGGINALRLGGAIEWFPPSAVNGGKKNASQLYFRLEE